jgi:hypothetical protein
LTQEVNLLDRSEGITAMIQVHFTTFEFNADSNEWVELPVAELVADGDELTISGPHADWISPETSIVDPDSGERITRADGPERWARPEALCGLLEAAGFSEVEAEQAEVTIEWRSPEAFTTFVKETVPPVIAMTAGRPPAVQDATWEAITDAVHDATRGAGAVRLPNVALLATGRA